MHDDHMLRTSSATTYSSCVQLVILVIAFHSVLLDLISECNQFHSKNKLLFYLKSDVRFYAVPSSSLCRIDVW